MIAPVCRVPVFILTAWVEAVAEFIPIWIWPPVIFEPRLKVDPFAGVRVRSVVLAPPTVIFAPFIWTTCDAVAVEPIVIGAFKVVKLEIFTWAVVPVPVLMFICPDLVALVPIDIVPLVWLVLMFVKNVDPDCWL